MLASSFVPGASSPGRGVVAAVCFALLVGCAAPPDPDALLRRHDLDGAAAAWKQLHGAEVDLDHTVVDVLATRAATDPSITMVSTLDALEAARLLDGLPVRGIGSLEVGFDKLETVLGAAGAIAQTPALFAVGRSATPMDKDVFRTGLLPWRSGRIVGWTRSDAPALGRTTDEAAIPRLVTIALQDGTGAIWITAHRHEGLWWTTASTDAAAAARIIQAADLYAAEGAAAVRARLGRGLLQTAL